MYKLDKLWKDKRLSIETKKRLMFSLVWPVATYGCLDVGYKFKIVTDPC